MDQEEIKRRFFELKSRNDVATLLGLSERSLRYFLFKRRPENLYNTFQIVKKDGSKREISAPKEEWKTIQRKLAAVLTAVYDKKPCAYGFVAGRNCIDNAKHHVRKRLVFNIDLKDFFSQIHFGRVRGMLMSKPYCIKEEAATTIAQIACANGRLPQGAPSSPIITNMIAAPLDNALMRLAKKANCVYTRYADDITFSTYKTEFDQAIVCTDNGVTRIGDELEAILEKHSFEVNPKKVTLRSYHYRQEVTGLTVNEFPNLRRDYTRRLRAILHSCEKYGMYNAAKVYIEKGFCKSQAIKEAIQRPASEDEIVDWFKLVLIGKVRFIGQVKGRDNLTYLSFAKQVNTILDENIFDISLLAGFNNTIKSNVLILLHEEGADYIQGSAFYIPGFGLFTSYHVTESGDFFRVYSIDTYSTEPLGTIAKDLNEISSDRTIDYALYRFKPSPDTDDSRQIKVGDSKRIKIGDSVTIIGYPNYKKGYSPYIQSCTVTSEKRYHGELFYTVSGRVIHGASGGVVLNDSNEAIGIIKGGVVDISQESQREDQGFVPLHLAIEHFQHTTQGSQS